MSTVLRKVDVHNLVARVPGHSPGILDVVELNLATGIAILATTHDRTIEVPIDKSFELFEVEDTEGADTDG